MPQVRANGVNLHYVEMGAGPETVVFSHSYLLSSHHFHYQMEALQDRYRCLAYDHRGHGRSEVTADGYDMENVYADGVAFIEALGCAPCHFVGLSTGGFIGLRIAIRRPELLKSLVLMDTSADAQPPETIRQYKVLIQVVRWLGWRPVVGRLLPLFFAPKFLADPARRDEKADYKTRIMANDRAAMRKFAQAIMGRASVWEQLPSINTPTLVMAGEKDIPTPAARAKRIAAAIPGAELVLIPNAGHICTIEEPELVNANLKRFLDAQS